MASDLTFGQPGDPTNDATLAWPPDREKVDVGTLTVDAWRARTGALPRRQFRSAGAARRHRARTIRCSAPAPRPIRSLHAARGEAKSPARSAAASNGMGQSHETRPQFPAFSRLLHWAMAVMILAMLFIGVGMVALVSDAITCWSRSIARWASRCWFWWSSASSTACSIRRRPCRPLPLWQAWPRVSMCCSMA